MNRTRNTSVVATAIMNTEPEASISEKSNKISSIDIEYACCSDKGVRVENQDAVMVGAWTGAADSPIVTLAVADGMGGYEGGKIAAKEALQGFMTTLFSCFPLGNDEPSSEAWIAFILDAYRQANLTVNSHAKNYPQLGTTLVTLLSYKGMFHIANIGDSRAYLIRNGELKQMTRDDSFVQHLIDTGTLAPEEAQNHPLENIITRSLGANERLETLPVISGPLLSGDVFLLATDGFWKVAASMILQKCDEYSHLPLTCLARDLVETAKIFESDDNISVALLRLASNMQQSLKTKTYWQ